MPKNRHFFTCQKKKRLVTLLIGLILLLTTPGILAETTDEPAEEAVYRKTWLNVESGLFLAAQPSAVVHA